MDGLAWLSNSETNTSLSPLAAEMLRMYLRGAKDPALISKVGQAIQKSKTFAALRDHLINNLQAKYARANQAPPSIQVLKTAQRLIDDYRETGPNGKPRKIYFDQDGLQPVIGGVTKLEAESVEITATPNGFRFKLLLRLGDSYDFQNSRDGEYDRFRKELARLFQSGQRTAFWKEYLGAFYGFHKGLDSGNAFASFMYAVETGGCFRPVDWDVLLPVEGTVERATIPQPLSDPTMRLNLA